MNANVGEYNPVDPAMLRANASQAWSSVFGKHLFRNHSDQNVATENAKINTRLMTRFGSDWSKAEFSGVL